MAKISLLQMKAGQKARIAEISGGKTLEGRLMSMNVYKGKEITMLSHSMLKGPVTIKVGSSVIALGHGMAGKVTVERE